MDKLLKLKVYKEILKNTKKEYYKVCNLVNNAILYSTSSEYYKLLNQENLLRRRIYALRNEIKDLLKEI